MSTTYRPHSTKTTSWTCAPCTVRPDPAVRNWTRRYDAAGIPDIAGTQAGPPPPRLPGRRPVHLDQHARERRRAGQQSDRATDGAQRIRDGSIARRRRVHRRSARKRRPCNAPRCRAGVRIAATTGRPRGRSAPGAAQPEAAAQEPAQAQAALSDEEIESRLAHIRAATEGQTMHAPCHRAHPREYAHEHYVSPPFDEDDLRACTRKTRSGSPELDAADARHHPGHSWHPGWAAAAPPSWSPACSPGPTCAKRRRAGQQSDRATDGAQRIRGRIKIAPPPPSPPSLSPRKRRPCSAALPRRSPHCRHNRPPRGRNVSARRPARRPRRNPPRRRRP